MIKRIIPAILALFFTATSVLAIEIGGLTIPDTLDSGQGTLVLNGAGIRKKFGFKVYVGGLYLKAKSSDSKAIIEADEPMAVTLTWKRSAPRDKAIDVYTEGFGFSAGSDYDAIKKDIDAFLAALVPAEKSDIWKYLYLPGQGVLIYHNGTLALTVTDFKFKKALFAIWLLEGDTFGGDKNLQVGMLGK
ncbi:MAG: chalcone isomerase family protein [Pseudomonadota bacterium]